MCTRRLSLKLSNKENGEARNMQKSEREERTLKATGTYEDVNMNLK
jgi:hypothetical protein